MNLSVCFEPDNCQVVYDIFNNVRMPRPTCDWDKSYKMSGLQFMLYLTMLECQDLHVTGVNHLKCQVCMSYTVKSRVKTTSVLLWFVSCRVWQIVDLSPSVVKPKTIKMVFSISLSMQHKGETTKTGWLKFRIMCLSRATCLSIDCCFSELTL